MKATKSGHVYSRSNLFCGASLLDRAQKEQSQDSAAHQHNHDGKDVERGKVCPVGIESEYVFECKY